MAAVVELKKILLLEYNRDMNAICVKLFVPYCWNTSFLGPHRDMGALIAEQQDSGGPFWLLLHNYTWWDNHASYADASDHFSVERISTWCIVNNGKRTFSFLKISGKWKVVIRTISYLKLPCMEWPMGITSWTNELTDTFLLLISSEPRTKISCIYHNI